jgi:hypothetical protein
VYSKSGRLSLAQYFGSHVALDVRRECLSNVGEVKHSSDGCLCLKNEIRVSGYPHYRPTLQLGKLELLSGNLYGRNRSCIGSVNGCGLIDKLRMKAYQVKPVMIA